jgi:hypothetical protein
MGDHMKKNLTAALVLSGFAFAPAWAQNAGGVEYVGSGFMTLGVGKMLGGTDAKVSDYKCPCFIADYAQAGVYENKNDLQWKPDTKLGVQGSAFFDNRRFGLTTQIVARGARDGDANLEWLYGSYKINDKVTLQVGRKRLSMFYFSDTQDVGFALPWAHLPPQLYGWEAVNYNGANLMIQDSIGDWSATLNLVAGGETFKNSGYWKIYNGRRSQTDVRWKNIVGGDLTLQKDWLETRFVFLQSQTQTKLTSKGVWDPTTQTYDGALDADWWPEPSFKQRIYGVAVNIDRDNWLLRSELIRIDRPGQSFRDFASIVGVGYRYGKWQPMITHSRYWGESVSDRWGSPVDDSVLEGHRTIALTLRYDLTTSSAIKLQYDSQKDQSGKNWSPNYGNSRLLTATYDVVF